VAVVVAGVRAVDVELVSPLDPLYAVDVYEHVEYRLDA
jgi:hypothetical protein